MLLETIGFFESLKYQYLQFALLSTILVGVICGIIGVFVVLKGMSFLGAGIAHSCFAGGALAILLGTNPFITIFLFGESAAMIIGFVNDRDPSGKNDTAVGIMFSFTMALAILFIGLMDSYSTNVQSLLFGNALTVPKESMWQLIIVGGIILAIFFSLKKEFFFIIFDEEMAKVSGIPVRLLNYIFIGIIAGIVTVSIQAIGAILVFAMIVTPGAAAHALTYNVNKMLGLASLFGAVSSSLGLILSFYFDLPTGSTIVMVITFIYILCFTFSPKRKAYQPITQRDQLDHQKYCKFCVEDEFQCPYCEDESEILLVDSSGKSHTHPSPSQSSSHNHSH